MLSHNSDALNGLRRYGIFHNLGPKWSEFVQAWRHIPSDPPKVALVWLVLPDTLSTPVNLFWSALHALVSHYQDKHVPVLLVEVVHVGDQVLDHVHVGQRVDLGGLVIGLDLGQTRQGVHASCKDKSLITWVSSTQYWTECLNQSLLTNIHSAGATDALAA